MTLRNKTDEKVLKFKEDLISDQKLDLKINLVKLK